MTVLPNVSRILVRLMLRFTQTTLNEFASLPRSVRRAIRLKIREDIIEKKIEQKWLIPLKNVEMCLPMTIGGYSDYYCSIEHVRNASGRLLVLLLLELAIDA